MEPRQPLVHRFEHAEQWIASFDDPARDAWQKPESIIASMKIAPGMTVADIGAGTGYFEPHLSRAVGTKGTVLAVDIEPDMVAHLRERAAKEHLDVVQPILAEVSDPKLPSHKVDRIVIVDTWHHVPERAKYLEKLRAALAPSGTLTIVDFTMEASMGPPLPHRIKPDDAIAELRAAGFKAELVDLGLPNQWVIVAE